MRRASVKVTSRPEAIERVKKKLEERGKHAKPATITVGIHDAEGSQPKLDYQGRATGSSLALVATAHEFGLGVPERSWLRTWFDQNRARLAKEMTTSFREHHEGNEGALEEQGDHWAEELREWIEQDDAGMQSLTAATIREKERAGLASPSTPLVATHQLVAAIKPMLEGE